MGKEIPLIDSFEVFTEFNSNLHYKANMKGISIKYADCPKNIICYTEGKQEHCCSLDVFMLNFVKTQGGIIKKGIEYLNTYDFSRLYYHTHRSVFVDKLKAHVENLILIGVKDFELWDFQIRIENNGGLTVIDFKGSYHTKEIVVPEGITKIGWNTFSFPYLENIKLPKGLIEVGACSFALTPLQRVTLPTSVETIGEKAFYSCRALKSIKISKGLKDIKRAAFFNCESLEQIEFPKHIRSIGDSAFCRCDKLDCIEIPESIEYIGHGAFSSTGIKTVILPNNTDFDESILEFSGLAGVKVSYNTDSIG